LNSRSGGILEEGRGVTGVVPVKECGAKDNLWPDGRLFVQVCKRKGGGVGRELSV